MVSGVANIRVGAVTESEWKERKQRAENALNAVRAAAEGGIVAGGGVALVRAGLAVRRQGANDDPACSRFARVLEEPLRRIVARRGDEPARVVERIASAAKSVGYDVTKGELCDFMESGVIDATKVVTASLTNAVSAAGQLIMADCIVALGKTGRSYASAR